MSKQADEDAIAMVSRLCTEWPLLTREDFHKMLTPDCQYVNMPVPEKKCVGPDQAYALIAAFVSAWKMNLRMLNITGDSKVVLTERLERFESKVTAGKTAELHVMGAFELKDGKIAAWRDYFDSKESKALTS
jgi:limonene-1,2-epoxide hydrolase